MVSPLIPGKELHFILVIYAALTVMRSTPSMQPWMTISGMNVNNLNYGSRINHTYYDDPKPENHRTDKEECKKAKFGLVIRLSMERTGI